MLTVLCDRVDVTLLGQLYQIIVSPWIKVTISYRTDDVVSLLLIGSRWLTAEERLFVVRKVNELLFTVT